MPSERKATPYPTLDKPLSLRGQNRLLTAHNLMWKKRDLGDSSLNVSPEVAHQRCLEALAAIQKLPDADRNELKSHVDWVEAYGFEEPAARVDPVAFLSDEYEGEVVDPDDDETTVLMAMASVEAAGLASQKQS